MQMSDKVVEHRTALANAIDAVRGTLKRLRRKKAGVLVYVGLHRGGSFEQIFRDYGVCYGFEANPDLFQELQKKYGKYANVHLANVAVCQYDGEVEFHISDNDGASSSIGHFDPEWGSHKSGKVRMVRTVRVPCINLLNFFAARGLRYIDAYVSDIQGMDLEVLKTLKPMIETRSIGTITCEVTKTGKHNIYQDLPDNTEPGFVELLGDHYEVVAKGWGHLEEGKMEDVPAGWWEFDCMWRARRSDR